MFLLFLKLPSCSMASFTGEHVTRWFSRLHTRKTLGKLYGNCISCLLCDPAHSGCWSSYCVQVSMSMLSKIKVFCVSASI